MATILVVDDERLICDLLQVVLRRHGHEVLIASSDREALALFTMRRPRLVIVDICMPGSSGIELLTQIHWKDPSAAVMILTRTMTENLTSQARKWGVTEILSKGIPLDDLMEAVDRAITQSEKTAPPSLVSGEGTQVGTEATASILVVDDDPVIRNLLTDFLTKRGYRVQTAQDGQTALALAAQGAPHLIVLDIHLPDMNGVAVLQQLRARRYDGSVIVLSGSQDEKLLDAMLKLGVVELTPKPFDLERLALAIKVGLILSKH